MSNPDNLISVTVLDRSYTVKCPPEEAAGLQEAARFLDEQMKKIRHANRTSNADRVAVVAALNICSELMALKKTQNQYIEMMGDRISNLQNRIQKHLAAHEEVAV